MAVSMGLISKLYVIWHLYVCLTTNAVSDLTGRNGNGFDSKTVEELSLRPGRVSSGEIAGNKKLSHLDFSSGFAELCCRCLSVLLFIRDKARGAFHTLSRRVFFIETTHSVTLLP